MENIRAKIILFVAFAICAWVLTFPVPVTKTISPTAKNPLPVVATTTQPVRTIAPVATTTTKVAATSTPVKNTPRVVTTPKSLPVGTATTTQTLPTPHIIVDDSADFVKINTDARKAVVNILCSAKDQRATIITGTGVLVDPSGIILTNAHIGRFWLTKNLYEKDYLTCVIRTGSPAYPQYHAELVYISPSWIEQNKAIITGADTDSRGEYDFAFLRITDNIDGSKLPVSFPYIPISTEEIADTGTPVILVSYPSSFLGGQSILQGLNVASAITSVKELFTFAQGSIDLVSVPGTVVSQNGSSGGAVIDAKGTLRGIITTRTDATHTSDRDLRAITTSYINRDMQDELNITLPEFLKTDLAKFAELFAENDGRTLTEIIKEDLKTQ